MPRLLAVLVALVLASGLLAGCSHGDAPAPGPSALLLRSQEQRVLDARVQAIRQRNLPAFMRTVARGNKAFVARQRRYFANMVQLPLATFHFTVLKGLWPDQLRHRNWGANIRLPRVQLRLQLRGYDAVPVTSITGLAFRHRNGRTLVVGDRTPTGATFPDSSPAPWDLTAIHTRHTADVLGIFDNRTQASGDEIVDVVSQGITQVSEGLPFTWKRRVVVYTFANKDVLASFSGVPGGNIRHLGALTFPVYADTTTNRVAGMRFTLLPSSVDAGQPFLGRIVRHELTHVAVGVRDDGDPVWFAEGLAEYMGARDVPVSQRRIASIAVTRAREGADRMPASASFNGNEQDWHYALSWMACDYIAETRGEATLWRLMAALHDHGKGTRDAAQDHVLMRLLGYDSHELARRAAAHIRSIYG